jgi:hypothetical protein
LDIDGELFEDISYGNGLFDGLDLSGSGQDLETAVVKMVGENFVF